MDGTQLLYARWRKQLLLQVGRRFSAMENVMPTIWLVQAYDIVEIKKQNHFDDDILNINAGIFKTEIIKIPRISLCELPDAVKLEPNRLKSRLGYPGRSHRAQTYHAGH